MARSKPVAPSTDSDDFAYCKIKVRGRDGRLLFSYNGQEGLYVPSGGTEIALVIKALERALNAARLGAEWNKYVKSNGRRLAHKLIAAHSLEANRSASSKTTATGLGAS